MIERDAYGEGEHRAVNTALFAIAKKYNFKRGLSTTGKIKLRELRICI